MTPTTATQPTTDAEVLLAETAFATEPQPTPIAVVDRLVAQNECLIRAMRRQMEIIQAITVEDDYTRRLEIAADGIDDVDRILKEQAP